MHRKFKILYVLLIIVLVFLSSCSKNKELEQPKETILVEIGDVTISLNEFLRRAEYTVRPPYCRSNGNLDKKIILNSLIAEKLFSMEATDSSKILKAENTKLYLQGLKEQAMRQWLYSKEADEKVVLDSAKILNTVKVAGRKYKVSYFSLPDSNLTQEVVGKLDKKKPLQDIFYEITGVDSLPSREIEWSISELDVVLDSLYSYPLKKNQVVGPIKTGKNEFLFVKINGWIDRPIIIEKQFNDRWKDVSDKFRARRAGELYNDYVMQIMKNKKIEFFPEVFFKMANILGPEYLITNEQVKEQFNKSMWQIKDNEVNYNAIGDRINELKKEPFFKVNEKIYTVNDFLKEIKIHPLVFRKSKIKRKDFGQQLQYAIMDLIRDKYLTAEAYERGYDKINLIQRNVNMWKDNLNYAYAKEKYLHTVLPDSAEKLNYLTVLEDYLNKYADTLQKKYSNKIKINVDKFNAIKLSRIDMSVNYNNQPYKRVVPSFPIVTTDNKLDYGKKM